MHRNATVSGYPVSLRGAPQLRAPRRTASRRHATSPAFDPVSRRNAPPRMVTCRSAVQRFASLRRASHRLPAIQFRRSAALRLATRIVAALRSAPFLYATYPNTPHRFASSRVALPRRASLRFAALRTASLRPFTGRFSVYLSPLRIATIRPTLQRRARLRSTARRIVPQSNALIHFCRVVSLRNARLGPAALRVSAHGCARQRIATPSPFRFGVNDMLASSNPETQIQIEKLCVILRDLGPGETADYAVLSEAAGFPIQSRPFPLMKARQAVEEEQGLRFETVASVGVRKLTAEAVPGIGKSVRRRVSRAAKRAAKRLTGLRYNNIDRRLQARIDAERSLLSAISTVATAEIEEIEKTTTNTGPMVARQVFDTLRKERTTK